MANDDIALLRRHLDNACVERLSDELLGCRLRDADFARRHKCGDRMQIADDAVGLGGHDDDRKFGFFAHPLFKALPQAIGRDFVDRTAPHPVFHEPFDIGVE